jgi:hypothetical protein
MCACYRQKSGFADSPARSCTCCPVGFVRTPAQVAIRGHVRYSMIAAAGHDHRPAGAIRNSGCGQFCSSGAAPERACRT